MAPDESDTTQAPAKPALPPIEPHRRRALERAMCALGDAARYLEDGEATFVAEKVRAIYHHVDFYLAQHP